MKNVHDDFKKKRRASIYIFSIFRGTEKSMHGRGAALSDKPVNHFKKLMIVSEELFKFLIAF